MGVVSIGKKQEPKKNGTLKGTIESNTAEASPSPAPRGCLFGPPQRRNEAEYEIDGKCEIKKQRHGSWHDMMTWHTSNERDKCGRAGIKAKPGQGRLSGATHPVPSYKMGPKLRSPNPTLLGSPSLFSRAPEAAAVVLMATVENAVAKTVKDVSPHEFVKAYSAHLKRSGKVRSIFSS
ncbi:hypothetical protein BHE74_00020634 [Ensete ventricosum]|nr:hypothetical protein GW17_00029968 [Ensete ventricosum]RWW71608.1 hypothetical protein BHE74_00020634 [Ensete ventricosum]